MPTDAELLRQYAEEGSEAAFAELVRRYIRLVYSVAARQAAGNVALAEDATQAVFIVLARQGPKLGGHETFAGWLHTCARYTTLRALRDYRRRQARELKAVAMEINETPKTDWEKVRPLLDRAVDKLNAADREAVLLRFFQGYSHCEVGATLGVSEDAARVRVERALEKVRRHLEKCGFATTGALLGEAIESNAAETMPTGLAGRVGAASALASATMGWGSWTLRIILMTTKTKIIIATAVVVILASIATVSVVNERKSSTEKKPGQVTADKLSLPGKNRGGAVLAPQAAAAPPSGPSGNMGTMRDPNQPLPGVYPEPKLSMNDVKNADKDPYNRNLYGNMFVKLGFTPEQEDKFIQIMKDASIKFDLSGENQNLSPDQLIEKIRPQAEAMRQEQQKQLRQLLGSDENYDYYNAYTNGNAVRLQIINEYSNGLGKAGVPGLTVDQQESLIGFVLQSIAPGASDEERLQEILGQAGTVLDAEQLAVLKKEPRRYISLNYRSRPQ